MNSCCEAHQLAARREGKRYFDCSICGRSYRLQTEFYSVPVWEPVSEEDSPDMLELKGRMVLYAEV